MTQAKGSNEQVIIQEETTFKTDPGTPDAQKLHFLACGVRKTSDLEDDPTIQSDRNQGEPELDVDKIAGPLSMNMQAYMGKLFKFALGDVTTTGAGPYTHTIKIAQSLPSFLLERGFTGIDQYFKYNGCKIGRMSFDVTPRGFQNISFDIIGAKETTGTSSFDATPTDLGKKNFRGMGIGTVKEGGSAIANLVGIQGLTIENDLEDDDYALGGAGELDDIDEGMAKISGLAKVRFEDLGLYNKAKNGTESSLEWSYILGTGDGSAGNEKLTMDMNELRYGVASPIASGPKGVYVELPFKAYYSDDAAASAFLITLLNTQATL